MIFQSNFFFLLVLCFLKPFSKMWQDGQEISISTDRCLVWQTDNLCIPSIPRSLAVSTLCSSCPGLRGSSDLLALLWPQVSARGRSRQSLSYSLSFPAGGKRSLAVASCSVQCILGGQWWRDANSFFWEAKDLEQLWVCHPHITPL